MNKIRLEGCTAEPLGSYLKSLAILRLLAEQCDAGARGYWDRVGFCIETTLDADGLVEFFLKRYAPTAILSPWNGGSGFYVKDRKVGIDAIAGATGSRFASYRDAIEKARKIVSEYPVKDKSEEDTRRTAIQLACRNQLPDGCVEWLDAAVGISAAGERTFAPILGTGGNEGRLDYTNNFMEYVADLLVGPDQKVPVEALLRNALFGTTTDGFQPSSVGQYDPGKAGGLNQGQGVETADFPSNPWNFVLTLEGGVCWAAGLYRRQGVACRSYLCSPFTVWPTPVGYASASQKDGDSARAEIWTPIWDRPATYRELRTLLREGRASIDGRPAQNGLEFAEAACLLGVDRGISGFVRYNILKRRGDSYVALPAGRFGVDEGRWEGDLVRELNGVLEAIDSQMKSPPAEFASLRRQVDEAVYNVLLRGGPQALEDVAACLGRLYRRTLLTGKALWIVPKLGKEWVKALSDRAESRIAAALASMWDRELEGMAPYLDRSRGEFFSWTGSDLTERLAKTLERRVILAEQRGLGRNALGSKYKARLCDVSIFLEDRLDDERIEDLLFAFTLVNWRDRSPIQTRGQEEAGVWPVYALLKHLFSSEEIETGDGKRPLIGDLRILAALAADDVTGAARTASRRLQNAGILGAEIEDAGGFRGMRLAAALLIPVPYGPAMRQYFTTTGEKR